MENRTRNSIFVFCALAITTAVCFQVISNELDKRRAINFINESLEQAGEILESSGDNSYLTHIKSLNSKIKSQSRTIQKIEEKNRVLAMELTKMKQRFATQIEAESNKANIIWSDGTSKPKYNQTQEGINWSN